LVAMRCVTRDVLLPKHSKFCDFLGFGYEQLSDFLATMGVQPVSKFFYQRSNHMAIEVLNKLAWKSCIQAGEEELDLAKLNYKGPLPFPKFMETDVFFDAAWSQRSYNHQYRAKSGMVRK